MGMGSTCWAAVLVLGFLAGDMPEGQQASELTLEQQQLRQKALQLNQEGVGLYRQARLAEANDRWRQAIELFQQVYPQEKFPDGHPDLATSLNNLGALLQAQGRYAQAETFYRQALQMRQKLYPKEKYPAGHTDLATSLNNLGMLLQAQGGYAQAETFYRQALQMKQALYPKEKHPDGHSVLALGLNNLGFLLHAQGKYVQAEPFFRQALLMRQALYPKDKYPDGHPDLASSLNNLGALLYARGVSTQAEAFFHQAVLMRQALYPKDKYPDGHPDLANSLANLGSLFRAQGNYAQAEPFCRQALVMYQALYPKEKYRDGHPTLATSLDELGSLFRAQGNYAQAEPFCRQALVMNQALYPREKYKDGHPDLATSLDRLGSLLRAQGEYAQAEPLYRQALRMRQSLYPREKYKDGHPDLATSLNNLGTLLHSQKEYAQAEPFYHQALVMNQALYPREKYKHGHPSLAANLTNLGSLFQAQGEYARAEPFYRQALRMYQELYPKEKYPDGQPRLAMSLTNLGYLLQVQGEHAQAEPFFRQALLMRQALYPREKYPDGHRDLAASLNFLGTLLQDQQEYAQAEPFNRQAVRMYQQQADRLARTAPEPLALNYAATLPLTRDGYLSLTLHLPHSDASSYEALWRSKASLTRVYQRRHLALIAAATDPSVRQAWEQLQHLRRQREDLLMAPAPRNAQGPNDKLEQLNRDIDQAEKELLPRLPALQNAEGLAQLGPDALQQRLPQDAVLVDFLRYTGLEWDPRKPGKAGEKRTVCYLAFLVSRNRIQRVELATEGEIDKAVAAWREEITLRPPASSPTAGRDAEMRLARQAQQVRQLVWEPIQKQLGQEIRTVFLAPDAALTQLPWAALPGSGQDRILLEEYALAVLPHGPFLLEQLLPPPPRSPQRPPAAEGLLLVGGLRYDDQPRTTLASNRAAEAVVEQKVTFGYLPGTEAEQKLLEQLLQKSGPKRTAVLSGTEGTTARLRQELEQARYAHIGTHGFFADRQFRSLLQLDERLFERRMLDSGNIGERIGAGARSPLVLSGLVCSGANRLDTPERGILSADAIAGLLLDDLHLAVLSACDTGLGDVAGGEGVFGLQRAFHIAGCQNVVASLWKVDDAATAALMRRFYSYLFPQDKDQRLPPIEALRRAQLDLYRHPELIPAWSRGEARAPGKPRPATTPPPPETPPQLLTSAGRAPIRLWAAFMISGPG